MHVLSLLIALFVLLPPALAQELVVERNIGVAEVDFGSTLMVHRKGYVLEHRREFDGDCEYDVVHALIEKAGRELVWDQR